MKKFKEPLTPNDLWNAHIYLERVLAKKGK